MNRNRTLAALAAFQAVDAAICVQPIPPVAKALDAVDFPQEGRWILPVVKGASVIGLIGGIRFPWLAKLTLVMLTIYFTLAVGAHVKARDTGRNAAAASAMLVLYGGLTAKEIRA